MGHQGGILPVARQERDVPITCSVCPLPHEPMADWLFKARRQKGTAKCSCGAQLHQHAMIQPPLRDEVSAVYRHALENEWDFRFPTFVGVFTRDACPTSDVELDWLEQEAAGRWAEYGMTIIPLRQLREMYGNKKGWAEPIPGLTGLYGVGHPTVTGWLDDSQVKREGAREGFQGFEGAPFYTRPRNGRKKSNNFLRPV